MVLSASAVSNLLSDWSKTQANIPYSLSKEPGCTAACTLWKLYPVLQSQRCIVPLSAIMNKQTNLVFLLINFCFLKTASGTTYIRNTLHTFMWNSSVHPIHFPIFCCLPSLESHPDFHQITHRDDTLHHRATAASCFAGTVINWHSEYQVACLVAPLKLNEEASSSQRD